MSKAKEFAVKLVTINFGQNRKADYKLLKRKRGLSLYSFIITIIASFIFLGSFQGESLHVKAAEYEASVTFGETTTDYPLLTQAWAEANRLSSNILQAEVKVLKDVKTTSALTINSGKFITLDLNSFTINRGLKGPTSGGAVIINKGNFILDDTSVEGTGLITGGYNNNTPSSAATGGGIMNDTSSTFIMRGGNVSGNKSNYAGGIGLRGASFILEGGTITGNETYTTQGSGGGVYVDNSSFFEMKGGIISGNKAIGGGGGLILIESTGLMSGGKITGNSTSYDYGGGGVYINKSDFKMTGGEISLNSATSGNGGGIYQYNAPTGKNVVIAGGIITKNTGATGKFGGGIHVVDNFYIAGDANITGNVVGGTITDGVLNGGTTSNLYLGNLIMKVGYSDGIINEYNFTGKVGVYSNKYSRNEIFAKINNNSDISAGEFSNDRDEYLFGLASGTNIVWDYRYSDPVVITAPTATTPGLIRQTAIDVPSETRDITVNVLNTTDYEVSNDAFDDTNPKVTYTLKDTTYGVISFEYDLPPEGNSGYVWTVQKEPTFTAKGSLVAGHSSYPGLKVEAELPVLTSEDYDILVAGNITYFTLKDKTYGDIIIEIDTDDYLDYYLSKAKADKIAELEDYVNNLNESDYSAENWATILNEQTKAVAAINAQTTIEGVGAAKDAGIAAIKSVKTLEQIAAEEAAALQAAKDAAKAELDNYVENPSSAVEAIIDTAKAAIDGAATPQEVADLLAQAKADVDAKVAEEAAAAEATALQAAKDEAIKTINDKVAGLIESDYSPENWATILNEQTKAIAAINAQTTIEGVGAAKDAGLAAIISVPTLLETGYDTPVVNEPPTGTTGGTATVTHPDLPGETIDIDLPPLDGENYDITVKDGEVIYTYIDEETGVSIEVYIDLPDDGYSEPDVSVPPTSSGGGTATVTHPDLPGATIEIELPALGDDDYVISVDPNEDATTGEVTYTYHDEETNTDVTVTLPYDQSEFDWNVNIDPTATSMGSIVGTNSNLPGVTFELELPKLSADYYDITDNGDGTFTYTLKDRSQGIFSFTVPAGVSEDEINLWPYIIAEIIIILILGSLAYLKRKRNEERKAKAAVISVPALFFVRYNPPKYGILTIIILAIIIVLVMAYIIYLFLEGRPRTNKTMELPITTQKKEVVTEVTYIEQTSVAKDEKEVNALKVKEEKPKALKQVVKNDPEVTIPVVTKGAAPIAGSKKMPPLYNYSFQARRHLMDDKTLALYNTLKNHIMCYKGVNVNQTWDHEIFMTSGRAFARLRFHGKTFKLYLDVNVADYPEPKFPLIDQKSRKVDGTTPTLLNIKGPRMMKYGLELIDEILIARGVTKHEVCRTVNYEVKAIERDELIKMGLIVLGRGKFVKPVLQEKPVVYNYSFKARLHLMPAKERKMYNKLKNYLEKFEDVTSNQTWDHEIFMKNGRAFAKLRFHGKTFKLYLDVKVRDYPEPKFALIDESKKKTHESTPTLLNIKGPRMLAFGLDLINDIAMRINLKVNDDYQEKDYTLKKKRACELFDEGLIKSSDGTFTIRE